MFKLSLKDCIEIAQKTEVKARSLGRGRDDGVFEEQQFVKENVQETSGLLDCKEGWRPLTGAGVVSLPCVLQLWGAFGGPSVSPPDQQIQGSSSSPAGASVPHQLLRVPDLSFSFLPGPRALGFDYCLPCSHLSTCGEIFFSLDLSPHRKLCDNTGSAFYA